MKVDSRINPYPVKPGERAVNPSEPKGGRRGSGEEEQAGTRRGEAGTGTLIDKRGSSRAVQQADERSGAEVELLEKKEEAKEKGLLEKLNDAVDKMNREAEARNLALRFEMHEDSGRWMVKIIDKDEDEIIREVPPEKLLDIAAHIREMTGLLVDQNR